MKEVARANINAILNIIEAIFFVKQKTAYEIIDTVKELPAKLKQWGVERVQGFVEGIIETWNSLKASVASIFGQAGADGEARAAGVALGRDWMACVGESVVLSRAAVRCHSTEKLQH